MLKLIKLVGKRLTRTCVDIQHSDDDSQASETRHRLLGTARTYLTHPERKPAARISSSTSLGYSTSWSDNMSASDSHDRSRLDGCEIELFELVRKAATPEQWKEWLRAPLEHSAADGNMELFTRLLDAGADGRQCRVAGLPWTNAACCSLPRQERGDDFGSARSWGRG